SGFWKAPKRRRRLITTGDRPFVAMNNRLAATTVRASGRGPGIGASALRREGGRFQGSDSSSVSIHWSTAMMRPARAVRLTIDSASGGLNFLTEAKKRH